MAWQILSTETGDKDVKYKATSEGRVARVTLPIGREVTDADFDTAFQVAIGVWKAKNGR
jgi:hypothetical protein